MLQCTFLKLNESFTFVHFESYTTLNNSTESILKQEIIFFVTILVKSKGKLNIVMKFNILIKFKCLKLSQ